MSEIKIIRFGGFRTQWTDYRQIWFEYFLIRESYNLESLELSGNLKMPLENLELSGNFEKNLENQGKLT